LTTKNVLKHATPAQQVKKLPSSALEDVSLQWPDVLVRFETEAKVSKLNGLFSMLENYIREC